MAFPQHNPLKKKKKKNNVGVVRSNPAGVTMKTPLVRKANEK